MKKRILSLVLLIVIFSSMSFAVSAEGISGTYGDNITWKLEGGVLTISGTGVVGGEYDPKAENIPWAEYADQITDIVLKPGITQIRGRYFSCCSNLKTLTITDTWEFAEKKLTTHTLCF